MNFKIVYISGCITTTDFFPDTQASFSHDSLDRLKRLHFLAMQSTRTAHIQINWQLWEAIGDEASGRLCFDTQSCPPYNFQFRPPYIAIINPLFFWGMVAHTPSKLEKLPLELLYNILRESTLESVLALRRVNRNLKFKIDNLPEFERLARLFPRYISVFETLGASKWITLQRIYDAFSSITCVDCGNGGDIIHTLTCRRICYTCLEQKTRYLPFIRREAWEKYALSAKDLQNVPHMKLHRGRYGRYIPGGARSPQYRALLGVRGAVHVLYEPKVYDHDSVLQAAVAVHGSVQAAEEKARHNFEKRIQKHRDKVRKLRLEGKNHAAWLLQGRPPEQIVRSTDWGRVGIERYMVSIRAPAVNFRTGEQLWDLDCAACGTLSSVEELESHLDEFGPVLYDETLGWIHD